MSNIDSIVRLPSSPPFSHGEKGVLSPLLLWERARVRAKRN